MDIHVDEALRACSDAALFASKWRNVAPGSSGHNKQQRLLGGHVGDQVIITPHSEHYENSAEELQLWLRGFSAPRSFQGEIRA